MTKNRFIVLTSLFAAACGGSEPAEPTTPLTTVDRAAVVGAWTSESALATPGDPQAIGVDGDLHMVVIADGAVHALDRGQLELRPLYVEGMQTPSMGRARAVFARPTGGAWIATDVGIFGLDRHFVTRSPMSEVTGEVNGVAEAATGPLAGVWVASADGLRRGTDAQLAKLSVPGLGTPVDHVAVDVGGTFAVAASGAKVAVIEPGDSGLVSTEPVIETGVVHAVAAGPGKVWVAAARGLFSTNGIAWTRYALGGAEVTEVAVDPGTGTVWARVPSGLISIRGDALQQYPSATGERGLAVDRIGDVYSMASGALIQRGTGASDEMAATFTDVKAWIQTHCSQCHSNQTEDFEDYSVFVERAEDALSRVRSGDMPRCTGSVRCAPEEQLTATDYAVLEQWIRDGMPE